jgi:hypothetical protein
VICYQVHPGNSKGVGVTRVPHPGNSKGVGVTRVPHPGNSRHPPASGRPQKISCLIIS